MKIDIEYLHNLYRLLEKADAKSQIDRLNELIEKELNPPIVIESRPEPREWDAWATPNGALQVGSSTDAGNLRGLGFVPIRVREILPEPDSASVCGLGGVQISPEGGDSQKGYLGDPDASEVQVLKEDMAWICMASQNAGGHVTLNAIHQVTRKHFPKPPVAEKETVRFVPHEPPIGEPQADLSVGDAPQKTIEQVSAEREPFRVKPEASYPPPESEWPEKPDAGDGMVWERCKHANCGDRIIQLNGNGSRWLILTLAYSADWISRPVFRAVPAPVAGGEDDSGIIKAPEYPARGTKLRFTVDKFQNWPVKAGDEVTVWAIKEDCFITTAVGWDHGRWKFDESWHFGMEIVPAIPSGFPPVPETPGFRQVVRGFGWESSSEADYLHSCEGSSGWIRAIRLSAGRENHFYIELLPEIVPPSAPEESRAKAALEDGWRSIAESLWKIIDDIDTAFDQFKPKVTSFTEFVNRKQKERFKFITSDGYTLTRVEPSPEWRELGEDEMREAVVMEGDEARYKEASWSSIGSSHWGRKYRNFRSPGYAYRRRVGTERPVYSFKEALESIEKITNGSTGSTLPTIHHIASMALKQATKGEGV